MTNQRGKFTREFKLEAISAVIDDNRKVTEVADSLGIGHSTLDNWVRKYRQEQKGIAPTQGKALTDEQRELQQLRQQVRQLTMERDILKKASALLALDSLKDYR